MLLNWQSVYVQSFLLQPIPFLFDEDVLSLPGDSFYCLSIPFEFVQALHLPQIQIDLPH
jgi:hypothetical protein